MPRKQHSYHYIYKTTCKLNGKFYIGMHSTSNLEDGYLGSGKVLRYALHKHGSENFHKEILEFLPDRVSLAKREREIVNQEMLNEEKCINLRIGGEGGFLKHMQRCSSAGNDAFVKRWNEDSNLRERFAQMSSLRMKKTHAEGKISYDKFTGKSHSKETKQKMREKAQLRTGPKNSQHGTCWITNGSVNRKVKKTDELPIGWTFGRIRLGRQGV